jgi:hypothetical protein
MAKSLAFADVPEDPVATTADALVTGDATT